MIVAMLSLIVAMLTGGHRSPSAIRDLQKRVRKYVKEPDRKKPVLEILKTQVAARKRLDKRVKQYQTMLRQLAGDRETTREELTAVFQGLLLDYRQAQTQFIDARLAVVGILPAEEFEQCIDRDHEPTDKAWRKTGKKLDTHLVKLKTSAKAIEDAASRKRVLAAVETFEQDLTGLLHALAERSQHDEEALASYSATREALIASQESINEQRKRLYGAFIDLHQDLATATTDRQWKAAARELKALT